MTPSYLALLRNGVLAERAAEAVSRLGTCHLCPRLCGVDRLGDRHGHCRTGRRARVASYQAHFGEERCLVGLCGSGTIFFSSCNLLCTFCQNVDISHHMSGVEVEPPELAEMMLLLQERGCHNINFVTPTHVIPQILEALVVAANKGLEIPLVYNSGGYERTDALRLLDGIIDIYMPDFKFWDEGIASRYTGAPDYRHRACEAVQEMHRQVGDLRIDPDGIARHGLLVRHLIMPNDLAGTHEVMHFLADAVSPDTHVNVMAQYRPLGYVRRGDPADRSVTVDEFARAVAVARKAGLVVVDGVSAP